MRTIKYVKRNEAGEIERLAIVKTCASRFYRPGLRQRLPTVREADVAMLREGFQRKRA